MFYFKDPSQLGGDYNAWFSALASQLLQSELIVNKIRFKIVDIEVHFYSDKFPDIHCRKSNPQEKMLYWYYSNENQIEILDITFVDEKDPSSYGGFLLRGLEPVEKCKYTSSGLDSVTKIIKMIKKECGEEFLINCSGKSLKEVENIQLEIIKTPKEIPLYKTPRQGIRFAPEGKTYKDYLESSLKLLRFSTKFKKEYDDDAYDAVLSVICYFQAYDQEACLFIGREKYREYVEEFKEYVNNTNCSFDKHEMLYDFAKYKKYIA